MVGLPVGVQVPRLPGTDAGRSAQVSAASAWLAGPVRTGVPVVSRPMRQPSRARCSHGSVVPVQAGGCGVRCENQHPRGGRPAAAYVVETEDGKQRAICGDCAAIVVTSERRVHLFPIEAVGEQSMKRKARAQGRHPT
jgi:hypothetical protein